MSSPHASAPEPLAGTPGATPPRGRPGTEPSPQGAGEFRAAVAAVVRSVPAGEVVTYGEVAAEAGHPGAARAVASVLRAVDGLPWWRVVSARGRVYPGAVGEATGRLADEGVLVVDGHVRSPIGARRGQAPPDRRTPSGRPWNGRPATGRPPTGARPPTPGSNPP